jgi:hypothetical protein
VQVAKHLGVLRRHVRLATPAEVLESTGYRVGTVPPFGHYTSLRTLVDIGVTELQSGMPSHPVPARFLFWQVYRVSQCTLGFSAFVRMRTIMPNMNDTVIK